MMRCFFVMMIVAAACGPSNMQVKTAMQASYEAPPQVVFRLAQEAAAENYRIGDANAEAYVFATEPQFYSREGGRQSPGAEDFVQLTPGSVRLSLAVEIVEVGPSRVAVVITPETFEVLEGSPKPRELAPDDPSLPPWVKGRVESLAVAIHERAKALHR